MSLAGSEALAAVPLRTPAPAAVSGPAGAAPRVSVVLCTSGRRPAALDRCLRSLSRIDGVPVELVLVDNSPRRSVTSAALADRTVRVVHEPRRGLDLARNHGVSLARAPIVAFIDDDCEVTPDWLVHIVGAFDDPAVGCVTGRVMPGNPAVPTAQWFEARFSFDRGERGERFHRDDDRPYLSVHPWQLGTGCNMAFRTRVLLRLGGFDPALDMGSLVGGGGDLDMFRRLLESGATAVYEPRALVYHHHRADRVALGHQFFGYGASVTALATKALLTGRGRRRRTLGFLRAYLIDEWGRVRRRMGNSGEPVPVRMFACEIAGHAWGPIGYLIGCARHGGRPREPRLSPVGADGPGRPGAAPPTP